MTPDCLMCFDAGWILDAKVDRSPTTLELIPCIHPECSSSGREVAVLCTYGKWLATLHPANGTVMSLKPVESAA